MNQPLLNQQAAYNDPPRVSPFMRDEYQQDDDDNSYRLLHDGNEKYEEDRLGFIRKVYGIMCTQLLITACFTCLPYISEGFRIAVLKVPWIALMCAVGGLVISCSLFCVQSLSRKVPTNYILMLAFTACEAYMVMFMCAAVNDGLIVI